jgi:phage FluMu protein Com
MPHPHLPGPEAPDASIECRCLCGSLVARATPRGVELKCRRCKRILLVPWDRSEAHSPSISEASGPRGPEPSHPESCAARRSGRRLGWPGSGLED